MSAVLVNRAESRPVSPGQPSPQQCCSWQQQVMYKPLMTSLAATAKAPIGVYWTRLPAEIDMLKRKRVKPDHPFQGCCKVWHIHRDTAKADQQVS